MNFRCSNIVLDVRTSNLDVRTSQIFLQRISFYKFWCLNIVLDVRTYFVRCSNIFARCSNILDVRTSKTMFEHRPLIQMSVSKKCWFLTFELLMYKELKDSMENLSFPREWKMKENGQNSLFFRELFPENGREFPREWREFLANILWRIFPKIFSSFPREWGIIPREYFLRILSISQGILSILWEILRKYSPREPSHNRASFQVLSHINASFHTVLS